MNQICGDTKLLEYNPSIPCNPYDDVIFKQLPENEKSLIQACGYTKLDSKEGFENMLLDVSFLDSFFKKKKGSVFEYKNSYKNIFLKEAEIKKSDRYADMLIPPERVPPLTAEKDSEHLSFKWSEVPNDPAAHSIFLYVNPNTKRDFAKIMFTCVEPASPPPTPPEILRKQEAKITRLLTLQKNYLEMIQFLITSFKEHKKMDIITKAEEADPAIRKAAVDEYQRKIHEIETFKSEYEDGTKVTSYYKLYCMKMYIYYTKKEKVKSDIQALERQKVEMKARFDEGQSLIGKPKYLVKKLFISFPTQEDLKKKEEEIKTLQKKEQELDDLLVKGKQLIIDSEQILPISYTKTEIEKQVESWLSIPDTYRAGTKVTDFKAKVKLIKQYCIDIEKQETEAEGATYKSVSDFLRDVKAKYNDVIEKEYVGAAAAAKGAAAAPDAAEAAALEESLKLRRMILKFIIDPPTPSPQAFDEYKELWDRRGCESSKEMLPTKSTSNEKNFIVPTYDSYLYMLDQYKNEAKPIRSLLRDI
jgi:hypothetical protein